jgi:hypothetical protein
VAGCGAGPALEGGLREPVARRDILPLTLVVVVGYIIFEVYSVATGTGSPAAALPLLVMQSGMLVLFTIGYRRATDGTTAGGLSDLI